MTRILLLLLSLCLLSWCMAGVVYHIQHRNPSSQDVLLHGLTLATGLLALLGVRTTARPRLFKVAIPMAIILMVCTITLFFLGLESETVPDHHPYKTCCSTTCGLYSCVSVSMVDYKEMEVARASNTTRPWFLTLASMTICLELLALITMVCRVRSLDSHKKEEEV